MGWMRGLPPVICGAWSPTEETYKTSGAADLAFRQLLLKRPAPIEPVDHSA